MRWVALIAAGWANLAAAQTCIPADLPEACGAAEGTATESASSESASEESAAQRASVDGDVELDALRRQVGSSVLHEQAVVSERERRFRRPRGRRGARLPPPDDGSPRAWTAEQQARVDAAQAFLCRAPNAPDSVEVRYRLAVEFYRANRFETAAYHLQRVARSSTRVAHHAAYILLDTLSVLLQREDACRQTLETSVEELVDLCASGERSELCDVLPRVRCQVRRRSAERLGNSGRHQDAAEIYLADASSCDAGDEYLYNAAVHLEDSGQLLRAIEVRRELMVRYPESQLGKRAIWRVATNYDQLGMAPEAAAHYVEFARRFPGEGHECDAADPRCPNARLGLERALSIRVALRDDRAAAQIASDYASYYARRVPERTARVALAAARIQPRPERSYRRLLRGGSLPFDVELEARLALARSAEDFALIRQRWNARPSEVAEDGALRDVAGEASFREAEAQSDARLRSFARLARSPARLRDTLREVEAAYAQVAATESVQWTIAAARRLGELYRRASAVAGLEALRLTARERFEFCFQTAVLTRVFGDDSEACAAQLDALDEEPAPAELVGAPQIQSESVRPQPVRETR
ncbi:MAG: hypothetical protein AAGE52_24465 [Myxococcota bacterium]